MDPVFGLNHWLDQIALRLEPAQRRELMRRLAQGLRTRFRDRIKQQRDPDGYRYIPRKRDQIGNIRRQGNLFQRIGSQIKTEYTADHAAIGFGGRTAMIARIHQDGRTAKPTRYANPTRYPRRELVGFSGDDIQWVQQQVSDYLAQQ